MSRLTKELAGKNEELASKNRELEEEIAQRKALKGQLSAISRQEAARWGLDEIIGESQTMKRIFRDIRLMQESPTTGVLITGESGTGKELIARAIHYGSSRKEAPFVPVNATAIPSELVESALFGHVRGSFTGANADQMGYFEAAEGGTLFLDEIGDMPFELQGNLLRVLEDGVVQRIGARTGRRVDVRILAATNANIDEKIDKGTFRQDLFYRLARFTVDAPPLRDRKEDIPVLARHFVVLIGSEMGREPPVFTDDAMTTLTAHDYPGNIRELKNIIERAMIECEDSRIEPRHLHFTRQTGSAGGSSESSAYPGRLPMDLAKAIQRAEYDVVQQAVRKAEGNLSEVARLLGTSRNRIYRILNQGNNL